MHTVTSFHASAVQPDQLNGIMADYLALERARIFRRLLVKRFGLLALILAGVSLVWLSAFAFWFSVGLSIAVPVWAWTVELGCERRLARRLDEVPTQAVQLVEPMRPDERRSQESHKKFVSTGP
jgi:hypothetical protein